MSDQKPKPAPRDDELNRETTGHVWDGIEEWNNPLPRWWVWVLYATIIWGVGYTIAYPAWPLLDRATQGLIGYDTRLALAEETAAVEAARGPMMERLAAADLTRLHEDPELLAFAQDAGASVFRADCSQCHGAGAGGVQAAGFPSLLDDDWIWGGTIEDIAFSVAHGIRNDQSPEARWSEMPAYADILSEDEIAGLAQHVLALAGREHDAALAAAGAPLYAQNCAACHGDTGLGLRELGAPNLADAVWLYGGSAEEIEASIALARFGVMPAWAEEFRGALGGLTLAEVNAVAAYVHGLGGGE
jgi:cytochrome c oxidase cbb3-type subunit 3